MDGHTDGRPSVRLCLTGCGQLSVPVYVLAMLSCGMGVVQEGLADRSKEVNERLLMEVRRRLQAARSQLNTGPLSEGDAGTPVDSPLGGRPKVLQGPPPSGTTLPLPSLPLCMLLP